MSERWLTVVGIGEDGMEGLSHHARTAICESEVVFGGKRHLAFIDSVTARKIPWQSPLEKSFKEIDRLRGCQVTVLATGNPLWYGIGSALLKRYDKEEIEFHSSPSSFALAAIRMGWAVEDTICQSVHGRPMDNIRKHFSPGARILLLAQNAETPSQIAEMLCEEGFPNSKLTALAHMGGDKETVLNGSANCWRGDVPDFHTLAVELVANESHAILSRVPGLPDSAFENDGILTKRDIRSATLARLAPVPEQHLWDVGAGCGSIAIEWMRAERNTQATAIESKEQRVRFILNNAKRLGVPGIKVVDESAPECLGKLNLPDAIFVGGGLSKPDLLNQCLNCLKPNGRLVANAVTHEGEKILIETFGQFGGELNRLSVSYSEPVGGFTGWRPAMPVTQWSFVKK